MLSPAALWSWFVEGAGLTANARQGCLSTPTPYPDPCGTPAHRPACKLPCLSVDASTQPRWYTPKRPAMMPRIRPLVVRRLRTCSRVRNPLFSAVDNSSNPQSLTKPSSRDDESMWNPRALEAVATSDIAKFWTPPRQGSPRSLSLVDLPRGTSQTNPRRILPRKWILPPK